MLSSAPCTVQCSLFLELCCYVRAHSVDSCDFVQVLRLLVDILYCHGGVVWTLLAFRAVYMMYCASDTWLA